MAFADKSGIEKLVYKATAGDVTIAGEKLEANGELIVEKLVRNTARGTIDRTGNKQVDFDIFCSDSSLLAPIESDEGNLNDIEIYQLGNTTSTPDKVIPSLDLITNEIGEFDPASDTGSGFNLRIFRIFNG